MVWVGAAAVALLALYLFPRTTLTLAGLATLAGIGVIAWIYIQDEKTAARYAEDAKQRALVTVKISYGGDCTGSAYPLKIITENRSSRTIEKMSVYVTAKRPGYSSVVYSDYLTTDRILEAKTGTYDCWAYSPGNYRTDAVSAGAQALNWSVELSSVDFSQ